MHSQEKELIMAEMTDAKLSLSVARIMYPEYEWKMPYKDGDCIVSGRAMGGIMCKSFDYQAESCAFNMSLWLANNKLHKETACLDIYVCQRDPQHALAMAILEIAECDKTA